ncbi:MAG: methyltransferase domain-containing protein [Caulobacterales bacterium]
MPDLGEEFTRRLLVDAGIGASMRVLDIGCGSGDVALLAGALVGEQGQVFGVDREAGPLALARDRARGLGLTNVTFVQGDFDTLPLGIELFDAAVGRRVLMYQPDAVLALAQLARGVRPGGLIVFQEHDTTMTPASLAPMPLHRRAQGWIRQTIEREGADLHMGFGLYAALTGAGLAVERVRAEAIVQTPNAPHAVATIIRAMLPRIVSHGVATENEIDIDTLDRRLGEERTGTDAIYVGDVMFGAWARKPR